MKKQLTVLLALLVLAAVAVEAASAAKLPRYQRLQFQGAAEHAWLVQADSPNDRNSRSMDIEVGDPGAGEYLAFWSRASLRLGLDVAEVKNLSFEYSRDGADHVGAGAPRISLQFQNGDIGYLSALYCDHPMAITGDTFGRADFTRFKSNCSFFVTGSTGGQYSADGSRDAFQVYADANPDQVLEQAYFVADETGSYKIDRISLAAGVMYQRANNYGRLCTTEASC